MTEQLLDIQEDVLVAEDIEDLVKEALEQARNNNLPMVAAYIQDGMGVTFATSEQAREAFDAIGHLITQIVLDTYEPEEDNFEYLDAATEALEHVADKTYALLTNALSFNTTAN